MCVFWHLGKIQWIRLIEILNKLRKMYKANETGNLWGNKGDSKIISTYLDWALLYCSITRKVNVTKNNLLPLPPWWIKVLFNILLCIYWGQSRSRLSLKFFSRHLEWFMYHCYIFSLLSVLTACLGIFHFRNLKIKFSQYIK